MPNWDADEGPGFDHFHEDDGRDIVRQRRRNMYGRAQTTQPPRMWNGQDVRDMETDHIMNAILFCEKKFAEARINHESCFPDPQESFYFKSVYDMFPDYKHLRDEWERRK